MSDMVDRVARAMFDATALVNERWNDDPDSPQRRYFRRIARAAIGAMWEPTREMSEAGQYETSYEDPVADDVWRKMIDVALGGAPPTIDAAAITPRLLHVKRANNAHSIA